MIDTLSGLILFVAGMGWTVSRYAKRDRAAFAVVAVLSPLLAIIAAISLAIQLILNIETRVGPCPDGLEEAEQLVEEERQHMFGGELRKPTYARSWQRAYELELQREASKVKNFAQKVFIHA
jgi:hypothetical protein